MKKYRNIIALGMVIAATVALPFVIRATDTLFLGALTTVDTTTINTTSMTAGTVTWPQGWVTVQHAGVPSTNALVVTIQMSVDNTNWVNVATWQPSTTNAGSSSWFPNYTNNTVRLRASVTTTSSVQVGGVYHN